MDEPIWGALWALAGFTAVLADMLAKADLLNRVEVKNTLDGMVQDFAGQGFSEETVEIFNALLSQLAETYGSPAQRESKPPGFWFRGLYEGGMRNEEDD